MSDVLVIVVIAALVVALVAVLILARRRPAPGPVLDEDALRRLVERRSVARSRRHRQREPAPEPDLGRFALLSHEAAAAAEAADAVRRTAAEAADELRTRPGRTPNRCGPTPGRKPSAPSRLPARRPRNCGTTSSPNGIGSPSRRQQR